MASTITWFYTDPETDKQIEVEVDIHQTCTEVLTNINKELDKLFDGFNVEAYKKEVASNTLGFILNYMSMHNQKDPEDVQMFKKAATEHSENISSLLRRAGRSGLFGGKDMSEEGAVQRFFFEPTRDLVSTSVLRILQDITTKIYATHQPDKQKAVQCQNLN